MTDDRFYQRLGPFTLGEIAARTGIPLPASAPADTLVRGVAALETAQEDEVSVFSDVRHAGAFATSRARAIITSANLSKYRCNGAWLMLAGDPKLSFALAALMFYPRAAARPGVHDSARVDSGAIVGEGCQ